MIVNLWSKYQQFWDWPEFEFEPNFSIKTLKHKSELKQIAEEYLIRPGSLRSKFAFTATGFLPRPTGKISQDGFSGTFVMYQDSEADEGPKIDAKFTGSGMIEVSLLEFVNSNIQGLQDKLKFFMRAIIMVWAGAAILTSSPIVIYSIYKVDLDGVFAGLFFLFMGAIGAPYVFFHLPEKINTWGIKNYKQRLAKRFGGNLV